ncbi:hypothetical protein MAR_038308 [Mya arenaria]|uniref:EB domain-containing protein n=1 Tax=Mya arenaria TaxID=6604 RepID=A0ABY7FU14_MYAAR|nr:hypothetical protein MAR_038308 [Mya arenaria]
MSVTDINEAPVFTQTNVAVAVADNAALDGAAVGEPCDSNEECTGTEHADVCTDGVCSCSANYFLDAMSECRKAYVGCAITGWSGTGVTLDTAVNAPHATGTVSVGEDHAPSTPLFTVVATSDVEGNPTITYAFTSTGNPDSIAAIAAGGVVSLTDVNLDFETQASASDGSAAGGNTGNAFEMAASTGVIKVAAAGGLDKETTSQYALRVVSKTGIFTVYSKLIGKSHENEEIKQNRIGTSRLSEVLQMARG